MIKSSILSVSRVKASMSSAHSCIPTLNKNCGDNCTLFISRTCISFTTKQHTSHQMLFWTWQNPLLPQALSQSYTSKFNAFNSLDSYFAIHVLHFILLLCFNSFTLILLLLYKHTLDSMHKFTCIRQVTASRKSLNSNNSGGAYVYSRRKFDLRWDRFNEVRG